MKLYNRIALILLLPALLVSSVGMQKRLLVQANGQEEQISEKTAGAANNIEKTTEDTEEEEIRENELKVKKQLALQRIEKLHAQSQAEKAKQAEQQAVLETQAQAEADALAEQLARESELEAIEAAIVPGQYPVMGESTIKVQQMVDYFYSGGSNYPSSALGAGGAPDIESFCQIYYEEASQEGVRPEVAFAQTMKETGWLKYGGDASISQYNFAGLGTTGGGVAGNSYPDVRTGVRAQIQHLKAYATADALNQSCVDNRYEYVTKGCAPYVEWLGQQENPQGYGWATGVNYGYDIVEMIHAMRNF